MRGRTVEVTCKNKSCKTPFLARVADRKRGWGRYCSKSCKAEQQTRAAGRRAPRYRSASPESSTFGFEDCGFIQGASLDDK